MEVQYVAVHSIRMPQLKALIFQRAPALGCEDVVLMSPNFLEET
jgi:hypothetical protein